jgi:hypothetical protein
MIYSGHLALLQLCTTRWDLVEGLVLLNSGMKKMPRGLKRLWFGELSHLDLIQPLTFICHSWYSIARRLANRIYPFKSTSHVALQEGVRISTWLLQYLFQQASCRCPLHRMAALGMGSPLIHLDTRTHSAQEARVKWQTFVVSLTHHYLQNAHLKYASQYSPPAHWGPSSRSPSHPFMHGLYPTRSYPFMPNRAHTIEGPGQQVQFAPPMGPGSASQSGLIDPCNLFCKVGNPELFESLSANVCLFVAEP